jgi:hypothetical protein
MTKRYPVLLTLATVAGLMALVASPGTADANSRRHVSKPGEEILGGGGARGPEGGSAPEIDTKSVGLGIALAAGTAAILSSRRRRSTSAS